MAWCPCLNVVSSTTNFRRYAHWLPLMGGSFLPAADQIADHAKTWRKKDGPTNFCYHKSRNVNLVTPTTTTTSSTLLFGSTTLVFLGNGTDTQSRFTLSWMPGCHARKMAHGNHAMSGFVVLTLILLWSFMTWFIYKSDLIQGIWRHAMPNSTAVYKVTLPTFR